MRAEEFVERVRNTAVEQGVPFRRLRLIQEAQEAHAGTLAQMKGYSAIADAFSCFMLETVERYNTACLPAISVPLSADYMMFLQRLSHIFGSICAAQLVASNGYPLQGYIILRNAFDDLLMTAAACEGLITFLEIEGLEGITGGEFADQSEIRRRRKRTERRVQLIMTGAESGLSEATITALRQWDDLFDLETHGGRLSKALSKGWLTGQDSLPVLPTYNEWTAAMFINRFCEIAWMLHRLLPMVQPIGTRLPAEWATKWKLLDHAFAVIVTSISGQLQKPIGDAIAEFVTRSRSTNTRDYLLIKSLDEQGRPRSGGRTLRG